MASTLAWLDHDAQARDRMERVLALFEERNTVDELGLGAIRNAFSDRLFPGTSTIQTRLRYFLFIPWIYRQIEEERVPSTRAREVGREREIRLSEILVRAEDDAGVFGRLAGRKLKRLASVVYWGGLGAWGIRPYDGSRRNYHASLDAIYRRRDALSNRQTDEAELTAGRLHTWHPGLPEPPADFPETEGLNLHLSRQEAEYLQERVNSSHPDSFLAVLFLRGEPFDTSFPWEHPIWSELGDEHRELLRHARLFSKVAQGAMLLYNLLLARLDDREKKSDKYEGDFSAWEATLDREELASWSTERLWELTEGQGHRITPGARRFVIRWARLCSERPQLADNPAAEKLIRRREERLKGGRSRFTSQAARDRWGGASGLGRMSFRWPEVKTFLEDLHTGLGAT